MVLKTTGDELMKSHGLPHMLRVQGDFIGIKSRTSGGYISFEPERELEQARCADQVLTHDLAVKGADRRYGRFGLGRWSPWKLDHSTLTQVLSPVFKQLFKLIGFFRYFLRLQSQLVILGEISWGRGR